MIPSHDAAVGLANPALAQMPARTFELVEGNNSRNVRDIQSPVYPRRGRKANEQVVEQLLDIHLFLHLFGKCYDCRFNVPLKMSLNLILSFIS